MAYIINLKTMSNLKIFNYEGSPIQFEVIDGKIMANATLMCKAFSSSSAEWKRLESTKRYIQAVMRNSHIGMDELLVTKQGGNESNQGMWIHEKLILKLAKWLDEDFEVWCDDRIAELLRTGSVVISKKTEAEQILDVIKLLEGKAEQERAEKEHAMLLLEEAQPKVEYYDKVISSVGLMNITNIASDLGMTAERLNNVLHEKKIQYKVGGVWTLTSKYLDKGYAKSTTHTFVDRQGATRTSHLLKWTEKGKAFIFETLGLVRSAA